MQAIMGARVRSLYISYNMFISVCAAGTCELFHTLNLQSNFYIMALLFLVVLLPILYLSSARSASASLTFGPFRYLIWRCLHTLDQRITFLSSS